MSFSSLLSSFPRKRESTTGEQSAPQEKRSTGLRMGYHVSHHPKTSMTAHDMHHTNSMRSPIRTSSTSSPHPACARLKTAKENSPSPAGSASAGSTGSTS